MFTTIIPTLNEARAVQALIAQIGCQAPGVEIILVDGGSQDGTRTLASAAGARVLESGAGRGRQCQVGAQAASRDILLFLHADTILPDNAFQLLERAFSDPRVQIGTFRLRFDHPHPVLRLYALFSRFDSVFTRFGDQGIAVRRDFFDKIGGMPEWPLFEDVALLQTARRQTRIVSFPGVVTTSARRYLQNGVIRQQLLNFSLMIRYLGGAAPESLGRRYHRYRKGESA